MKGRGIDNRLSQMHSWSFEEEKVKEDMQRMKYTASLCKTKCVVHVSNAFPLF